MSETLSAIASMRDRVVHQREQIRIDFPNCTAIIDQFRAAFGDDVKAKHFKEGDKEMGKPLPFDGTDIDKLIRLDDMDAKRRRVGR